MQKIERHEMKTSFKRHQTLLFATVVAVSLAAATVDSAQAASTIYVGRDIATGSLVPLDQINHSTWDALLRKHVDKNGYVDYKSWHASSSDRQALTGYLNELSRGSTSGGSRDAKLAYWINAYNAVTVHGILREYPTSSIRNHTAKVFGYNIWKDLHLRVASQSYSLEQIEHQILRKMDEPRIHFAIVCASIGCPRLLNRAYTAAQVEKQLEINAKDFFSRSQNFRYDQRNRRFHMSAIMNWFAKDFGSSQGAQLKTIAGWLPTKSAQSAALQNAVSVSYLEYNWNLNDQASLRQAVRRR